MSYFNVCLVVDGTNLLLALGHSGVGDEARIAV